MISAKINGKKYYFRDNRELARYLLELIENPLAPFENRKANLFNIMDLIGFDKKAKYIGRIKNEEIFNLAYWEILLSLEGLGKLRGYSVKHKVMNTKSICNDPEKDRITINWNIWE